MRRRSRAWLAGAAAVVVAALAGVTVAPARTATAPYPGTYTGTLWKTKVAVEVGVNLTATLTTARDLPTRCGRISVSLPDGRAKDGALSLREQDGRGRIQDNYRTTVYTLAGRFVDSGRSFTGVFSYRTKNTARRTSCSTRASFTATLTRPRVVGPWDAGRYAGAIADGRPIAFALSYDEARRTASLTGLSWTVGPVACVDPYEDPSPERSITTTIALSGTVAPDGQFDLRTPTDSTTGAWGTVIGGRAGGQLQVGQLFDPDGTPHDSDNTWFCSDAGRWGGAFTAHRVG